MTKIEKRKGLRGKSGFGWDNVDAVRRFKTHHTVFESKEREIPALPDKTSREKTGALLTHKNTAGGYKLSGVAFDTQTLCVGIAAVFGTP
jgi:hypothetical protein